MRHRKSFSRLKRPSDQRKALMRSLLTALFEHKSIQTTQAKGKALKKAADKLLTKAKGGDDQKAIKTLMSTLYTKTSSKEALPLVKQKDNAGIVRLTIIVNRKGDNAPMVEVQFVA